MVERTYYIENNEKMRKTVAMLVFYKIIKLVSAEPVEMDFIKTIVHLNANDLKYVNDILGA